MKAIILGAGVGRRMQPLTRTQHKTMLQVGGRAIIDWILDALGARGIVDIAVVTGYRADDLTAYLGHTRPDLRLSFVHNERYARTNNIYSLALAMEQIPIDDDLLVIECDLIFEPAVLDRLLAAAAPNVALVDRYRSGMDGTVVRVANGIIADVIPPHRQGATFDFSDTYKTLNIYRFSRRFCEGPFKKLLTYYAAAIDDNQYYEMVLGILIYTQQETIHAAILEGERWAEIDDPNDLDAARFLFDESARHTILDRSFGGYWNYDILDFRSLRNQYFPSAAVLAELRTALPALALGYGSAQEILDRKLASYLRCGAERVLALNGASQAYPLLRRHFEGRRVAIPEPTFGEYPRVFPRATRYADTGRLDAEALIALARDHDALVLVNPNNPTGSTLPTDWIYRLAATNPGTVVILDESFVEFTGQQSILAPLEEHPLPNVVVLKSLSKTLGVPGLRLGCLYTAHREVLACARRELPIWNLNSVAEHFLEIVLKHRPAIGDSFRRTIADREQLAAWLASLATVDRVYPGGGNFLLVALRCAPGAAARLVEALLLKHKIYLPDLSDRFPGQSAHLRIAVRLPEENALLVHCLREASAALSGAYGAPAREGSP